MNWKTAVVGLITAVIGALVGPYFTFKLGIGPKELAYRQQVRAPFIRLPDDLDQRLEVRHNGRPVKIISAADVDFVNVGGVDTEDIELSFLLEDAADKPSKLLDVYMLGPKALGSSGIVRLPDPAPGRVAFKLPNIKQWTSAGDYTYTARFLFEGETVPVIRPVTPKLNWDLTTFTIHPRERSAVFLVLLGFGVAFAALILWSRQDSKRALYRQAESLRDYMQDNQQTMGLSTEHIRAAVTSWLVARKQSRAAIERWWLKHEPKAGGNPGASA